jgi:hypothetical protein
MNTKTTNTVIAPAPADWIIHSGLRGAYCEQYTADSGIIIKDFDLDNVLAKLRKIKNPDERVYEAEVWLDCEGVDYHEVTL